MDFISALPSEILETILLFTVVPVPSPITTNTLTHRPVLRWEQELQSGESTLVRLLSPRLVSSRFCVAAWKLFGKVLGETIFDLRSRDSLGYLMAVSSCKSLAPWVKKLTIGFYSAPKGLKSMQTKDDVTRDLGSAGLDKLQRVHAVEMSWWPDVLKTHDNNSEGHEMPSLPFESSDTEWFFYTVARCLKALENLDDICFLSDERILPARYKSVIQHISAFQLAPHTNTSIQRRAQKGLDLLFQTMDMSGTCPSRLDISTVPDCRSSVTATPTELLQKVCSRTTDLTVRSSGLVSLISCSNLQHYSKELKTLNLIITNDGPQSLLPEESWQAYIPDLMKAIRPLDLNLLRIQLGTDDSWAQTEYKRWHQSDLLELKGKSERWLEGVAEAVQVQPKGFRAYLKRYGAWNSGCHRVVGAMLKLICQPESKTRVFCQKTLSPFVIIAGCILFFKFGMRIHKLRRVLHESWRCHRLPSG